MGVQDVIALTVAAGAVAYVSRLFWRTMNGRGGCGCGQGRRKGKNRNDASADSAGLKRVPLVTIDQVGTPCGDRSDDTSRKS